MEALVEDVVIDELRTFNGTLLDRRVHLTKIHRDRRCAQSPDRFLPNRGRCSTDALSGKVCWFADGLVGHKVPEALYPLDGEHLETKLISKALFPFLNNGQVIDLNHFFNAVHEVRSVHDSDLRDIVTH